MEDSAIFRIRVRCADSHPIAQPFTALRVWSITHGSVAGGSRLANSVNVITYTQEQGSSLVEALVAALIMTTAVVTMAQLLSIAMATNLAARRNTVAAILAEQKLEELRTLPWEYLHPAPSSTLQQNSDGHVDHIGTNGRIVGTDTQPPPGGIYTRRWSIEPVSSAPESSFVIQVLVTSPHEEGSVAQSSVRRLRGDARIVTVRVKK